MNVNSLFERSVTRDIPPVVYFHEQRPTKLADEVSEYIITGGWPKGHPNATRVPQGIHEEYVRLLRAIANELDKPGGTELPASWISGFYGSGKSSFAKLLGLALDGATLPDGSPLSQALIARDRSPRAAELVQAWEALQAKIDGISVVFDIGGVARGTEQIHAAIVRRTQGRLGYATCHEAVAAYELALERDGLYPDFLAKAQEVLGVPWSEHKDTQLGANTFSQVMHALHPGAYDTPIAWYVAHCGGDARRMSAGEATRDLGDMLNHRAPGKTLFIVIDEVSQYIHQDNDRMLKLQSFVSELGQRLKGRVWLLVTGQEKLDDAGGTVLGKMKDRFPPSLRVHLAATNIRDVVHRRLLMKREDAHPTLRELYAKHRHDMALFAHGCEHLTEEEFVDLYPLLPGYINLLLLITSAMRARSNRAQGDDQAIRGLLQMLGELFRNGFADRDVGALVCLEDIFEVQQSALDSDVQNTFSRLQSHCASLEDRDLAARALRAAKAVALLELIQEQIPTTAEMVAKALFHDVSVGSQVQPLREALEMLRRENLLGYSEKLGYKIQSTAGQEWEKSRREITVTRDDVNELVRGVLELAVGGIERPKMQGRPFPWAVWFFDGRAHTDAVLRKQTDAASVFAELHFVPTSEQDKATWVQESSSKKREHRIVWVVGNPEAIDDLARQYGRSRKMVQRYDAQRASLPTNKLQLLSQEKTREEQLLMELRKGVVSAFLDGMIYLRGETIIPRQQGAAFADVLYSVGERFLPDVYPHFVATQLQPTELNQLLKEELTGLSPRFMEGELGLFSLEAGMYVPTCEGVVPKTLLAYVNENNGVAGQVLLDHFGSPPFGYATSVTRAVLAALLRAQRIRIQPDQGEVLTSVRDVGATDLFTKDGPLRKASILPAGDDVVGRRARAQICKLFEDAFKHNLERNNEVIANAVVNYFPGEMRKLDTVQSRYASMGTSTPLPPALKALKDALNDVVPKARYTEQAVLATKKHLDVLRDGFQQLAIAHAELTLEAAHEVHRLVTFEATVVRQLTEAHELDGDLRAHAEAIKGCLTAERPWRRLPDVAEAIASLTQAYKAARHAAITQQQEAADASRARVMGRDGYQRLLPDESHEVLRPITEACDDPSAEAVRPPLAQLTRTFPPRLRDAEEDAIDRLDNLLAKKNLGTVVKVSLLPTLRHREVRTQADIDLLLAEIREALTEAIGPEHRVRIT